MNISFSKHDAWIKEALQHYAFQYRLTKPECKGLSSLVVHICRQWLNDQAAIERND